MEKELNISNFEKADIAGWLLVICCQLIFIGFVCSRALVSIGMIGALIVSLLFFRQQTFQKYFARKELLVLSIFFWIVLLSGIYSSDKNDWLNWVRIKLPYIALPLAFAPFAVLDRRQFAIIVYGFMLTFFISTALVLGNYFMHYSSMNQSFLSGSSIPMPFSHIRYTLMLAFSFFCAVYLVENKFYVFTPAEEWLQIAYAVFAFIALHLLTVRSALIGLYLGLLFLALYQIIMHKKVALGLGILVVLFMVPVAVYQLVPSVHNKVSYMQYDMAQYQQGNINQNSDAMRILSMKIGLEIWEANKLIGVGAGGLKNATDVIYTREHPEIAVTDRRQPHNQFIWVLATTGVIGLALFLFAFFYPLIVKGFFKHWLLMVFYIIIFSSLFTEVTLEEQMGTGFYLIFLMLLMNHFPNE